MAQLEDMVEKIESQLIDPHQHRYVTCYDAMVKHNIIMSPLLSIDGFWICLDCGGLRWFYKLIRKEENMSIRKSME